MSEYTPSRNEVLTALVIYRAIRGDDSPPSMRDIATSAETSQYIGEAERAIAAIEREAAARALRDTANVLEQNSDKTEWRGATKPAVHFYVLLEVVDGLRARAAEIREGKA